MIKFGLKKLGLHYCLDIDKINCENYWAANLGTGWVGPCLLLVCVQVLVLLR